MPTAYRTGRAPELNLSFRLFVLWARMVVSPRIKPLQSLRALAALLVAAFHLHAAAVNETGTSGLFSVFQRGEVGVDLFFVLSGFIITHAALARPEQTAGQFAAARFWRVVPPYWAALVCYLAAALCLAVATGDGGRLPDFDALIASIFLIPTSDTVIVVAWSLTIEVLFYALFAATWFTLGKAVFLAALLMWSSAAWALGSSAHASLGNVVLHAAVPEFLLGTSLAFAFARGWRWGQSACLVTGGAAFALAVMGALDGLEQPLGRAVVFGVPAAMLIWGVLGVRRPVHPAITVVGDASYLIYLLHLLVFYTIGRGVEMATSFNVYTSEIVMTAMLAIAIASSVAAHRWLERPYQRWVRARRGAPTALLVNPAR